MPLRTLLLIDDHPLFLGGISRVLAEGLERVVIVEAVSLTAALAQRHLDPALVLLDQQLGGVSGLAGVSALRRRWPGASIVMLSGFDMTKIREEAQALGVCAFISKSDKPQTLLHQVSALLEGVAETAPTLPDEPPQRQLTPRQLEVLELLCQGLSNKAIAARLYLSEYTVRGHVQALLTLLNASSRAEAAFAARRLGWVT
ncbi:LuxR C-terminal-related transcriptional regulator [Kushneria aurantia]|uniref:LuxR C-terminal-related transcriptional regulator n=1 Tax=Kushneria aurantia TaxID=504092 RepID=A0ABV6G082_9GAMM|nr:response regulator transcription factor [Kushneria aurantia]